MIRDFLERVKREAPEGNVEPSEESPPKTLEELLNVPLQSSDDLSPITIVSDAIRGAITRQRPLQASEEDPMPLVEPAYTYRASVRSIYDGDTIRVDLDLGFGTWIHNQPLRLFGIDTPEVRGPEREAGLLAKEWLQERIPPGTRVTVETFKDRTGKYGRYLAVIWHDGINLNDSLVEEGLAEPYAP